MLDPSSNFMNLTIGTFREWGKVFSDVDSILVAGINSPALAKFNVQCSTLLSNEKERLLHVEP
jgi:hypothetical protein